MDIIDKFLLIALDANCRASYEALSRQLSVSANAVRKRIVNLIDSNVITDFVVLLSPAMTGAEMVFLLIQTDGCEDPEAITDTIGNHPLVLQVTRIASACRGTYMALAEYIESPQLLELSSFVRSVECVESVEIHPLLIDKGGRIDFAKAHLKILRALKDDPRMQISEIARKTKLSARSARRILQQLIDSRALIFGTRWDLAAGGGMRFFAHIRYDEQKINYSELDDRLREQYSLEYWYSYVSATEPVVFANFVVEHLRDANRISSELVRMPFIRSAIPLIQYPTKKYPRIGMTMLDDILKETEL
ncbi:MAG: AsnC family transcriptional regulator [Candidatus Thorarchaeota archaeon]